MKPALMVNFSPLNCLANLLMTRMGAMGSPWDRAREVVPFQDGIHLLQTHIVDGETHQGVLHDGVVQLVLAALGAQSGVLSTVIPL